MKRIVITPGEPAGIGPDVVIAAAQQSWNAELIAIADPVLLTERAKLLGMNLTLVPCDFKSAAEKHLPGQLKIIPHALSSEVIPGKLTAANVNYVLQTLETAASLCMNQQADAIVTGPVHKGIINQAGVSFHGHTEFFAEKANIKQTMMLFVIDKLKVALVTTHLPLADVSKAVTKEKLHTMLSILYEGLQKYFHLAAPRMLVCGLNPHAGENGYLGREEIDVITPVLEIWQKNHVNVIGPLPADTIFTPKHLEQADAILAMYHDQALPLIKYIGFDRAVNMTLGLPYLRTSVDHGTALDIASTGNADAGSMKAAINLAIELN